MNKLVILGSGPAGLTAAIYASRGELEPTVIAGTQPGGQLMLTTEVENFPGFPDGIQGPELMTRMREQAARFGTRFVDEDAVSVDFGKNPFVIKTESECIESKCVIIATGASSRWMNVPGEREFIGRGVSSCATCDGFFYRGKEIIVVGGGDSAMEEATFLTKFASAVTVVHRRNELRASKIMQERAMNNPKISFIWNTVVDEVLGENHQVRSVKLRDVKDGREWEKPVDGVFVAIGHDPNTGILRGQVELNPAGYVKLVGETGSSVPGVFVAGDVEDFHYRQAVTAAGAGCRAAIDAEHYLAALK